MPADLDATLPTAVFMGGNLLGDLLNTTPAIRTFRAHNPGTFIIYVVQDADHCRVLDGNPDIDRVIYSSALLERGRYSADESWLRAIGVTDPRRAVVRHFDLEALHRPGPAVFRDHMSRGFARLVGIQIDTTRPVVSVSVDEGATARSFVPGPAILFGMNSTSPVLGHDGRMALKDWVFDRWLQLAQLAHDQWGYEIVALGGQSERAVASRHLRNLYGLPIKVVAALLQQAACVVTIDSGLSHLSHAVDAPMVLLCSRDVPVEWVYPHEATRCRVLHDDMRAIQASEVMAAMRSILSGG